MERNDHKIVYLLFSSLSSPSACVSPSDPTLTVENVTEVMREVRQWEQVASSLRVPNSKQQEIKQQSSSEREKRCTVGGYWVSTHPDPSWEKLALALYKEGEETALAFVKQYLPTNSGTYVCFLNTCNWTCIVWCAL